jgi:hypothetical protein
VQAFQNPRQFTMKGLQALKAGGPGAFRLRAVARGPPLRCASFTSSRSSPLLAAAGPSDPLDLTTVVAYGRPSASTASSLNGGGGGGGGGGLGGGGGFHCPRCGASLVKHWAQDRNCWACGTCREVYFRARPGGGSTPAATTDLHPVIAAAALASGTQPIGAAASAMYRPPAAEPPAGTAADTDAARPAGAATATSGGWPGGGLAAGGGQQPGSSGVLGGGGSGGGVGGGLGLGPGGLLTPERLCAELDQFVVGQERVKKTLAVGARASRARRARALAPRTARAARS